MGAHQARNQGNRQGVIADISDAGYHRILELYPAFRGQQGQGKNKRRDYPAHGVRNKRPSVAWCYHQHSGEEVLMTVSKYRLIQAIQV